MARFAHLITARAAHDHAQPVGCAACIARLREAAAFYGGGLLRGLILDGSTPWDAWLLFKREQLHGTRSPPLIR